MYIYVYMYICIYVCAYSGALGKAPDSNSEGQKGWGCPRTLSYSINNIIMSRVGFCVQVVCFHTKANTIMQKRGGQNVGHKFPEFVTIH